MIFIEQGMLVVQDQDEHGVTRTQKGERGQCLILGHGSQFVLSTESAGYRGHFIDIPISSEINNEAPWPSTVQIHQQSAAVKQMIERIEVELQDHSDGAMIPALYEILYWQMRRESVIIDESESLVHRISALLAAHCYTDDSLSSILQSIPYGQRHLRRVFKQHHGHSIKAALQIVKIQEAQRLLQDTALSITSIAFDLGFPSSQHFSSSFKRHVAMTPRAYRQRCSQDPGVLSPSSTAHAYERSEFK